MNNAYYYDILSHSIVASIQGLPIHSTSPNSTLPVVIVYNTPILLTFPTPNAPFSPPTTTVPPGGGASTGYLHRRPRRSHHCRLQQYLPSPILPCPVEDPHQKTYRYSTAVWRYGAGRLNEYTPSIIWSLQLLSLGEKDSSSPS